MHAMKYPATPADGGAFRRAAWDANNGVPAMPQLGITAHSNVLADDRRVAAGNDNDAPVMRKECWTTPPVEVASTLLRASQRGEPRWVSQPIGRAGRLSRRPF